MSINLRAWTAELIATYALVLFGPLSVTASIVVLGLKGPDTGAIILIGLTHGLVIALMIYSIGHISGAHINPAVTIPMMVLKKISVSNGIGYIGFQLIGAVLAAATHAIILPIGANVNYGQNLPGRMPDSLGGGVFSDTTVFGVELLLTFLLVFVIFGTAVSGKSPVGWAGFAIGMTVALDHFIGVSITGASMNPARTFGPAIISAMQGLDRAFEAHHIYWIAPILGGLIAAIVYQYVFIKNKK